MAYHPDDRRFLDLAARLALRGAGDVEPNPMVGAVLVDPGGTVIGLGHHRRFGGPHAEREALADCAGRGLSARGATLYVTLEPCRHHGKTPPCTEALIRAGIARVVAARRDPSFEAGGGEAALRGAGVEVRFSDASPLAEYVSAPFIMRTTAGRPWVIAKWAQTLSGDMRGRPDGSRWISSEAARRRVHRLRARVDAIITGMGTVLVDDPMLTARGVARVRRVARRVLVTTRAGVPEALVLTRTAAAAPVIVATCHPAPVMPEPPLELISLPARKSGVDLAALLRELTQRHQATNVLVEAGPTLLASFFAARLVDEAVVHLARGAGSTSTPVLPDGPVAEELARRYVLVRRVSVGGDAELRFLRRDDQAAATPP